MLDPSDQFPEPQWLLRGARVARLLLVPIVAILMGIALGYLYR
jgi:hypothetical protein